MPSFTSPTNSKKTVLRALIVDDMAQVRRDLAVLLQLSGQVLVVGEAGNGKEAILLAERLHPDVVIIDLEMPIMDGLKATMHIKKHGFAKRIVVLSIHSDPEDIARAMEAGADCFVQKGSPYTALMQAIIPNKL